MADIKNKYNSSFSILRANPRISGNVKISTDSTGGIWLNSIESNEELSKSIYKAFKISSNSDYSQDLYKFFNKGTTPTEFVFGVRNENSPVQTFVSDYADQYDGFYSAGVTPLISDFYTEDFSYLAPFWLGRKIPNYFVIYRIDDPIDFSYINPVTNLVPGKSYKVIGTTTDYSVLSNGITYPTGSTFTAVSEGFTVVSGQGNVVILDPTYNASLIGDPVQHFQNKILPKSSIVASYDLSSSSELGKYLRKIQASSNYKESLMDVRFEENLMTFYNGVNYQFGVYDTKGEFLYDFYTNPTTQIEFDQFMGDGFKRNGIISYKYINLEFLFSDPDPNTYSINRYFGVFVDTVPTGTFRLNGADFFNKSYTFGNSPQPKDPSFISDYMNFSFYQQNPKGVRLFYNGDNKLGYLPSSDVVNSEDRLYYIKDNQNNLYSYKRVLDYPSNTDSSYVWGIDSTNYNQLVISNKSVDLSKFAGFVPGYDKQINATQLSTKGYPYASVMVGGSFKSGEAIVVYHPIGQKIVNGKSCDIIIASDLSTMVEDWGPGSFYNVGSAIYFHPYGTNEQIASAIYGALNSIEYRGFEAFNVANEVVIRSYGYGYNYNFSFAVDCYLDTTTFSRMNRTGVFLVNGIDATDFRSEQFFIGGTDSSNNRIKITIGDSHNIIPGVSVIETHDGVSVIDHVFRYVDGIQQTATQNRLINYNTHVVITYSDVVKVPKFNYMGQITIKEISANETGVFSICPIKDFDYDFWSSEYGVTPTEEYYRYLDIQPNGVSKIQPGQTYCVNSGCVIEYNGSLYGDVTGSPSPYSFIGVQGVESFSVISSKNTERFLVIPLAFTKNPTSGALTGSPEPITDIDNFPGFIGIQDIKYIDDLNAIVTKKDQMFFGKLDTEYQVLKENYIKNFVTLSRVTPYITKWVYEGGTDARGNEYRLNVHPAFTPFNFSPTFFSADRDPRYFTNEWYLLETPRADSPDDLVKSSKSYCSNVLDITQLTNSDPGKEDYFTNYFTVDGKDFYDNLGEFLSSSSNPVSEKYTIFEYNDATGYSETLFRGVKIRIKGRTDSAIQTGTRGVFKSNDQTYDGYKFACLIRPIDDPDPYSSTPPITYKVYENKTFKTITFVISIINSDSRYVDGNKFWSKISSSPAQTGGSWGFNPTGIFGGLDYMSLYSLDEKLMLEEIPYTSEYASVVSDVKLSASLNFSYNVGPLGIVPILNTSTSNGTGVIPIIRNDNYNTDLRDEINNFYFPSTPVTGPGSPYDPSLSPPLTINGDNETGVFTFYSPMEGASTNWYTLPWPVGVGKNQIYFNQVDSVGGTGSYMPNFTNLGFPPPVFSSAPVNVSYVDLSTKSVYQKEGGLNYWKKLLSKLTFYDIYLLLNSEDPYVKYSSYSWDSTNSVTIGLDETFVLETMMPSAFMQNSVLYPVEDKNKPKSLAKYTVGYNLATESSVTEYYRYGGGYNPKFRDIIPFSNYKDDVLESEVRVFAVELVEKTKGSLYENIGSDYEIYLNGVSRQQIKLTRGLTYTFNFVNFYAPGYGPSPSNEIEETLTITTVQNDGSNANVYSTGVTLSAYGNSITFQVPYNAPDNLYYELLGKKFSGGSIYVSDNLSLLNTKFGIEKDNFGILKNISYNKYAITNPFEIDPNSGYLPVYPLIGQAPFDIRDISVFESTWDPDRFRQYVSGTSYKQQPGTRSMLEEKNFFGSKVMKTPGSVSIQKQQLYSSSITDVFNVNPDLYPGYEIFWEETPTQILCYLLVDRSMINYFESNGVGETFNRLLLPEFGSTTETTLLPDITSYLNLNVLPIYKVNNITVYVKKTPKTNVTTSLPPIVTNLADHEKIANGFYVQDQVNVIETDHLEYEFTFAKDPAYNYQLAFSYSIGKI